MLGLADTLYQLALLPPAWAWGLLGAALGLATGLPPAQGKRLWPLLRTPLLMIVLLVAVPPVLTAIQAGPALAATVAQRLAKAGLVWLVAGLAAARALGRLRPGRVDPRGCGGPQRRSLQSSRT